MAPPPVRGSSASVWQRTGDALLTVVFWALWLALGLAAAAQVYVVSRHELTLPRFLQVELQSRLEASGLRAEFGRTRFDPTGRLLVENVRLLETGFDEPIAEARSVYIQLDPWALLAGRFAPIEERASGVLLRVPALLSPSGRADEIVRDADFALTPGAGRIEVEYFSGWVGQLAVAGHGGLSLALPTRPTRGPLPGIHEFAQAYPRLSRQVDAALGALAGLEHPVLEINLVPGTAGSGQAEMAFFVDAARVAGPVAFTAGDIQAVGRWPVGVGADGVGDLDLNVGWADLPGGVRLRAGRAVTSGLRVSADAHGSHFQAGRVSLTAAEVSARGLTIAAPVAEADLGHFPRIGGEAVGTIWGRNFSVDGEAALDRRTASVRFAGAVPEDAVDYIGRQVDLDLRPFVALTAPARVSGEAEFGPGWRFQRVEGRLAVERFVAYHVPIDEARGRVEFDGRHLRASRAFARLGDNFAYGSFEQDVANLDYRFLLDGRLRPLKISPWIPGAWWPDLFGNFAFPAASPAASMDLRGNWGDWRRAAVFVRVDAPRVVARGVPLDVLQGRIFARPQCIEALDFSARRGAGEASGTFTSWSDLTTGAWQSLDIAVRSSLDLPAIAGLLGSGQAPVLASFSFSRPPRIVLSGRFTGLAAKEGAHQTFRLEADSGGPVSYAGFPLDQLAFVANVHDDTILLPHIAASVAGGAVTGDARVDGGAKPGLEFSAAVKDAQLSRVIAVLQTFFARRPGGAPASAGKAAPVPANVLLDASLHAAGSPGGAYDFKGAGTASLQGGEIGQIRMLGLLSELLRFTSLRFTAAHADFQVEGPKVVFPGVSVTGANSAINAHGTYSLDLGQLDFLVRLAPFQESRAFPQKFANLFLAPLTNVFEVRLLGTLDKPKWIFANGPANWIRNPEPARKPNPPQVP